MTQKPPRLARYVRKLADLVKVLEDWEASTAGGPDVSSGIHNIKARARGPIKDVVDVLNEGFENGQHYYAMHGHPVSWPSRPEQRPKRELLEWHQSNSFLG